MDQGQIIWSPLCKLQDPKDQMPTSKHSMTPSTGPVSILDGSQLDREDLNFKSPSVCYTIFSL